MEDDCHVAKAIVNDSLHRFRLVLLSSIAGLGYKSGNGKSTKEGTNLIVLHVVGESLPAGEGPER